MMSSKSKEKKGYEGTEERKRDNEKEGERKARESKGRKKWRHRDSCAGKRGFHLPSRESPIIEEMTHMISTVDDTYTYINSFTLYV